MEKRLFQISELINKRDIKKAEVMIARLMKNEAITSDLYHQLLLLRTRVRLLTGRTDEALHDLAELEKKDSDLFSQLQTQEVLADCYLSRFELAILGFAQKTDNSFNSDSSRHRSV